MESESDAKNIVTILHKMTFYEICQLKSADWLWLSATSVNLSKL